MEVNDELEIDIENKYMNKVVFTLEESIYILKRKDFCDEVEDMALDRLIKYIKEESIPKAVVEEKIEELDKIRRENVNTRFVLEYSMYNAITNEIDDLEELLNKGETDDKL